MKRKLESFLMPTVVTKQSCSETVCTIASINNFLQEEVADLQTLKAHAEKYMNKGILQSLFGSAGVSPDVAFSFLQREKGYSYNPVKPDQYSTVANGWISANVGKSKTSAFPHSIAIKNGYVVDSIGGRVYPWKGVIEGYAYTNIGFVRELIDSTAKKQKAPVVLFLDDD